MRLLFYMWSVWCRLYQVVNPTPPSTHCWAQKFDNFRHSLSESRQFRVLRKCQSKFDSLVFEMIFIKISKSNRPFYSCVLSCLAFEWRWGWCWACFDVNLLGFLMLMTLFSCWLVGIYTRKVVRFLSKQGQHQLHFIPQRPSNVAHNCKMVHLNT